MAPGGAADVRSDRLRWMAQSSGMEFAATPSEFDSQVRLSSGSFIFLIVFFFENTLVGNVIIFRNFFVSSFVKILNPIFPSSILRLYRLL